MIKLVSTSKGAWGPGSSPETSIEEELLIENEGLSLPAENIRFNHRNRNRSLCKLLI